MLNHSQFMKSLRGLTFCDLWSQTVTPIWIWQLRPIRFTHALQNTWSQVARYCRHCSIFTTRTCKSL